MAKPNNYFTNMINQRGEDWIVTVRPDEIQNSARRIVKDMAKGTIDYEKVGRIFLDPKFIENLLIGVSNELESNTFNYEGCSLLFQQNPNRPNLSQHLGHLTRLLYVYNTVYQRLGAVKQTGNIGYLADLSGLLYNDRNHII